jgi:methylated-DNA-[protein]-cysteine S-methyltransferase
MNRLFLTRTPTPIGDALLVRNERTELVVLDWEDCLPRFQRLLTLRYGALPTLQEQPWPAHRDALRRYFAGELSALDELRCDVAGTPFQAAVWRALRTIPAGETLSYGMLASRLGNAKAVRAVGLANGRNPVSLVLPCHRVVGADGALTGYAGGLPRKRWLLHHERANAQRELPCAL